MNGHVRNDIITHEIHVPRKHVSLQYQVEAILKREPQSIQRHGKKIIILEAIHELRNHEHVNGLVKQIIINQIVHEQGV